MTPGWLRRAGEQAERDEAEVGNDPLFGATAAARAAGLARWRRLATACGVAAWLAAGWLAAWPQPYAAAALTVAVLPWLAALAVALSRGRLRLLGIARAGHPGLMAMLFVPSFGLAVRALADVSLLDWRDGLVWLIGGGAAVALPMLLLDRQLRRARRAVLLGGGLCLMLATGPYAWGAALLVNALLDRAPIDVYRPPVLGKPGGGGYFGIRYLELAAWGPYEAAHRVAVSSATYDVLQVGDAACVRTRPGALRMTWIVVMPCR